jgi:hypothetical protein
MEGKLVKQQVQEDMEREKMKDLERKKKAARTREEFKKANDELSRIKAEMALKEEEENKRIEEYAKKREAIEHLKKTKAAERFRYAQEQKQMLVDKQIAQLMKLRD